MRLQYIASAAVLVEHNGFRVLCDPWLFDGAYYGAWYHNPPLTVTPEDFADVDAIFLSHIHPDHACFATLERLPKTIPIFIGAYANQFFGTKLRTLGFHVQELAHGEPRRFECGLSLTILAADGCNPQVCGRWIGCPVKSLGDQKTAQIDTMAVFEADGQTIWNVNDVPYELARHQLDGLKARFGAPDLLLVGYAGAGPWPQCFPELPIAQRMAAMSRKRLQFLRQASQFIEALKPAHYLPFAGQYTLGGPLVDLNAFRGVPELEDLDAWGDARMVRLNRMAWFDCETGTQSEPFTPLSSAERGRYTESLRSKRLTYEDDPLPSAVELESLLVQAQEGLWRRCAARGFTSEWMLWINGSPITFSESDEPMLKHVRIALDPRALKAVLKRQLHWNNLEVGSHLQFSRTPDDYDNGVHFHLSFLHV